MREILFRGFHPCEKGNTTIYVEGEAVKGLWLLGDLLHWYNTDEAKEFACIIPNEYGADGNINIRNLIVIPATVCQFTGLTDKNSVKIFEGDILDENGYCFTVVYDQKTAKFKLRHDGKAIQYPEWNRGVLMEVIGSIYDTLELLTKDGGE